MGERFEHQGMIYEDLGDGNVRVIGPANAAQPQPMVVGTPRAPDRDIRTVGDTVISIDPASGGVTPLYSAPEGRDSKAETEGDTARQSRMANLRSLRLQIDNARSIYERSLRGGVPNALVNLLPNAVYPALGEFESAASGVADTGAASFRVPGMGPQSDADAARFVAANTPQPGDSDAQIEQKLLNLETRLGEHVRSMGLDPAEWAAEVRSTAGQPVDAASRPRVDVPGAGPRTIQPNVGGGEIAARQSGQVSRHPMLSGLAGELRGMAQAGASAGDMIRHLRARREAADLPTIFPEQENALMQAARGGRIQGWENFENVTGGEVSPLMSAVGSVADTTGGAALISAANAVSAGGLRAVSDGAVIDANRAARPGASFVGDVIGSGLAMGGIGAAAGAAGTAGRALTGFGGVGGDMLYGGTRGLMESGGDPLAGVLGAGAALTGNLAGRYVVAPAAVRALDTRAGRAVGDAAVQGAGRVRNAGRGLFGRGPQAIEPFNPPAAPSPSQMMLANTITEAPDALQQLDNARSLGVPLTLADTTQPLRSLAGASFRRASPEVQTSAESMVRGRALGQSERGQGYITNFLGPVANPNHVSERLMRQARDDSAPLYAEVFAREPVSSPALDDMLMRPDMIDAMSRASRTAANRGDAVGVMSPVTRPDGTIGYEATPNLRTLDYLKQELDGNIGDLARNSGNRTQLGTAQRLRTEFVNELDSLYPGYAAARSAYAGPASANEALGLGQGALRLPERDIQDQMAGLGGNVRQYQLGARVALSDRLSNTRDTANPFAQLTGSPEARARMTTLFPKGGERFIQAGSLEDQIGMTTREILGGSPTAGRMIADEQLQDSPLGTLAVGALETAATGAPWTTVARQGLFQGLRDRQRLGIGATRRADELLPMLLADNPRPMIDDLMVNANARRGYVNRARNRGRMFGAGVATPSMMLGLYQPE